MQPLQIESMETTGRSAPRGAIPAGFRLGTKAVSFAPIVSALRPNRPIAPAKSTVICPAETRIEQSAIYLPGEPDRILGCDQFTTIEQQKTKILGGPSVHAATIEHQLNDVLFADGTLYHGVGRLSFRRGRRRAIIAGDIPAVEHGALVSSWVAEKFFGHWMRDSLLTERLASMLDRTAVAPPRTPWTHEPGYRQLTGLQVLQPQALIARKMSVFQDFGLNSHVIERLGWIRNQIRRAMLDEKAPRFVYVRRKAGGGGRTMIGEEDFCQELEKLGFVSVEPEEANVPQIVNTIGNADLVITVEGSHQNHALMAMKPGATLLTIEPPQRFNALIKPYMNAMGIHWAFMVADPTENAFRVPMDRLQRTMDLIDSELRLPERQFTSGTAAA